MTALTGYDIPALPNRSRMAMLALIYAAAMLYSSTLVGPAGVNFVYRDPAELFRAFLATPLVAHGSDQRADWIGNLLMLVPYGFLLAGVTWPRRESLRLPAMLGAILSAMLIGVGTILSIKYLQLFFPPRTVTLNYIIAQTVGAAIGCAGCAIWAERIGRFVARRDLVGTLVVALRLYAGALCLFVLMPLDFALNATDLGTLIERVPDGLVALPGSGRPAAARVVLIVVAGTAFIPVGMLLSFIGRGIYRVGRSLWAIIALGLLLTTGLYALSCLVISAVPAASAILFRTVGIVLGAAVIRWLVTQDADLLRQRLGRLVPWLVGPYLFGVLLVNQLVSVHWLSWEQAVAQAYPLGFLPLFDYYIVTKAEAAKNVVGHAVLYMPVGVMLWLRYGDGRGGRAFILAATLSAIVEAARYFRPGQEGDVNAVVLAGLAAMAMFRLMPGIWSMLRALRLHSAGGTKRSWRNAVGRAAERAGAVPAAEIEHY